jgi:hypothetical protein
MLSQELAARASLEAVNERLSRFRKAQIGFGAL